MRRTSGAAVIGAVITRSWPSASCRPTLIATSASLSSLTGSIGEVLIGRLPLALESCGPTLSLRPAARHPGQIAKYLDLDQGCQHHAGARNRHQLGDFQCPSASTPSSLVFSPCSRSSWSPSLMASGTPSAWRFIAASTSAPCHVTFPHNL